MTALFNLLNRMGFNKLRLEEGDKDGISVWLFAAVSVISAALTLCGGKFFKKQSGIKNVEIEIVNNGKAARLSGLVDSGNLLTEPISGRPCIVVKADALGGVLPRELLKIAKNDEIGKLSAAETNIMKRVRLVGVHTATGQKMLIGFRVDKVMIDTGKKVYESDAIVVLSRLDDLTNTEALVPSQLLN